MANQVKTYRVLRDNMKVKGDVRNFGDFMPEASEFSNLRSYLNAGYLEEIFVDQSVIDEFMEARAGSPEPEPEEEPEGNDGEVSDEATQDSDESDSDDSESTEEETKQATPKRPKRSVKKKPKAPTSEDEENGGRLSEQSV